MVNRETNMHGYSLNQVRFWDFVLEKMETGTGVMLLYVLESRGSSPGRQGFRMAVSADRDFRGSIGGGIMEHKFVEMALDKLAASAGGGMFRQVHDTSAARNRSGMICSGEQTIFMYMLKETDRPAIRALQESWQAGRAGTFVLSPGDLSFHADIPERDFYFIQNGDDDFLMKERTGFRQELHIIGGGHCSMALSELMSKMDFHITVYDDREGLSTMRDNPFAHRKAVVPSYENLAGYVPEGDRVFVVIMTFGYRTDDVAFRALAGRHYRYLGLLGSKKKIEKMFRDYRAEGMDEGRLQNVWAPVGIQIKSETPEEIAVSIAAQVISVKNKTQ